MTDLDHEVGGAAADRIEDLEEELRLTRLELVKAHTDLEEVAEKVGRLRRAKAKAERESEILAKSLSDACVKHLRERLAGRKSSRLFDRRLPSAAEWTQVNLLRQSQFFWPGWYLRKNLDVAEAGIEPALHFLRNGHREGRDPSPNFSLRRYRKTHSELSPGVNPLLHAIESGDTPPIKHKRKKLDS